MGVQSKDCISWLALIFGWGLRNGVRGNRYRLRFSHAILKRTKVDSPSGVGNGWLLLKSVVKATRTRENPARWPERRVSTQCYEILASSTPLLRDSRRTWSAGWCVCGGTSGRTVIALLETAVCRTLKKRGGFRPVSCYLPHKHISTGVVGWWCFILCSSVSPDLSVACALRQRHTKVHHKKGYDKQTTRYMARGTMGIPKGVSRVGW